MLNGQKRRDTLLALHTLLYLHCRIFRFRSLLTWNLDWSIYSPSDTAVYNLHMPFHSEMISGTDKIRNALYQCRAFIKFSLVFDAHMNTSLPRLPFTVCV
jgi:hypothetical protein